MLGFAFIAIFVAAIIFAIIVFNSVERWWIALLISAAIFVGMIALFYISFMLFFMGFLVVI